MKKQTFSVIFIALTLLLALSACSKDNTNNIKSENIPSESINTPIVDSVSEVPTPEPLPEYSFEEVVAAKQKKFKGGGDAFSVMSAEENYYGEITVGSKSYVEGSSEDIGGTYALFISEGNSSELKVNIKRDGYYASYVDYGTIKGDTVEYRFNKELNTGGMLTCKKGLEYLHFISNLLRVAVLWSQSSSAYSDAKLELLAVVITKDEAVRYVQDGTLPKCLQGLTVTGLDKIFRSPAEISALDEKTETALARVVEVVPPIYDSVRNFSDGMAAVCIKNKWGFIDKEGNEVIPLIYRDVFDFSDGVTIVEDWEGSNNYAIIDKTGKELVPHGDYTSKYGFVGTKPMFSEGLLPVTLLHNGKYGYIDTAGNEVIELKYDSAMNFTSGVAVVSPIVRKNYSTYAVINKNDEEIVPENKYTTIYGFSDGVSWVALDGKYGLIDTDGNEVMEPSIVFDRMLRTNSNYEGLAYVSFKPYSDGYSMIKYQNWNVRSTEAVYVYGFIDKTGMDLVEPKYSEARSFSDGMAAVRIGSSWGFIDSSGNEVVAPKYDSVGDFLNGFAWVHNQQGANIIDKTGKEILPSGMYSLTRNFSEGLAAVMRAGGTVSGYVDTLGNEVIPAELGYGFDYPFLDGMAVFQRDGKYGFISYN